ncbi:hypothetical protein HDV05_008164 [Chytridiales sp. JEL 0842]|nr:hypothetical protein HDV05_008164 [Chytridiales sp. JEL 0842]
MLMKRFTRLPITLFRIQPRLPVSLRDYDTQLAKNRSSFDLKLHNGLVLPMESKEFTTPNGMSLRPANEKMVKILEAFRGGDDLRIYRLQENSLLPEDLVVFHEHSDYYSMQVAKAMSLGQFNQRLTEYLMTLPSQSKSEFMEWYNDVDDQDN